MKATSVSRLEKLLAPGVEALGFELLAVELAGSGPSTVLRIFIDGPQGITVDDCAAVSNQVSGILDVEDPLPGHYTLEVSSPGLDRPLVKPEHFARFVGEKVRIWLWEPREQRRKWSGMLLQVDDSGILLDVDGEEVRLPFADMEKARLVPRL